MITLKHLRGDFFGGLTAGIVALPLALAFGEQWSKNYEQNKRQIPSGEIFRSPEILHVAL